MFHTTQCVKVPIGASGSSIIIDIVFVFFGTFVILRGGERSWPSQVNSDGIIPSFSKAELDTFNVCSMFELILSIVVNLYSGLNWKIHCDNDQ